jgi:hypothetical protein
MYFKKPFLVVFLFSLTLSGCAWFGVEIQKPTQVQLEFLYVDSVKPTKNYSEKITLGLSVEDVETVLGKPDSFETKNDQLVYQYPSRRKVRSGAVVCLGLIPIPLRSENDGVYMLYFRERRLEKILSLETKAGFHGVYMDDSGSGAVSGEKSKCDI